MEEKTRLETLVSLRNEQLELVLNREASIRMLTGLMKEDPDRVLTTSPNLDTMQPEAITVRKRMKQMTEAMEFDQARLDALEEMIREEREKSQA